MIHQETAEAYHAREAVSAGFLWRMISECPAQAYYESCFTPDAPPRMQSREFDIGTAAHLAVLEPDELMGRIWIIDAESYRTKIAQMERDTAYSVNRTPLLAAQYQLVLDLHKAIETSDAAELLFGKGQSEVSYTWDYEESAAHMHVPCKARADRITPHAIVDLKTAASASPAAFQRAMIRDGHHLRAAWYLDGWRQCGGTMPRVSDIPDYVFVVPAKTPPHLVTVFTTGEPKGNNWFEIEPHAIEMGRRLYRTALRLFRDCRESGVWPGYTYKNKRIGLPTSEEYRLAEMETNGELDL